MGSLKDRLRRLEARTAAAPGEEEVRADACSRMSTKDLRTLAETCRRLEALGWDEAAWGKLTGEERTAFDLAYAHYEEAVREARAGR